MIEIIDYMVMFYMFFVGVFLIYLFSVLYHDAKEMKEFNKKIQELLKELE